MQRYDLADQQRPEPKEAQLTAKDPICGMTIEESDAVGTSEYEGKTYYFCSMDCKEEFDSAPSDYAS